MLVYVITQNGPGASAVAVRRTATDAVNVARDVLHRSVMQHKQNCKKDGRDDGVKLCTTDTVDYVRNCIWVESYAARGYKGHEFTIEAFVQELDLDESGTPEPRWHE